MHRKLRKSDVLTAAVLFVVVQAVGITAYVHKTRLVAAARAFQVQETPWKSAPGLTAAATDTAATPVSFSEHGASTALLRAHRAAGMAALALQDGNTALEELEKARTLDPHDATHLAPLLKQARALAESAAKASLTRDKAKGAPGHPGARTASPSSGLILITSVPTGLPVRVDGHSPGVTPARIRVEAGRHTIVWLRGEQAVLERSVRVRVGEVTSVDGDTTPDAPSGLPDAP